jgi:hypothetical protein
MKPKNILPLSQQQPTLFVCGEGHRRRSYRRTAALRLIVQPWRRIGFLCFSNLMEHRWNYTDKGKPKYSEKKLSQCHFVPHGLIRDQNRASAVGGWRLTAWDMARPSCDVTTRPHIPHQILLFLVAVDTGPVALIVDKQQCIEGCPDCNKNKSSKFWNGTFVNWITVELGYNVMKGTEYFVSL